MEQQLPNCLGEGQIAEFVEHDEVQTPVVYKDLPKLLYAYDLWNSASLSAANDYDKQVRSVIEKAWTGAKSEIDASAMKYSKVATGISPQIQSDKDLLKHEVDEAASQCMKDGKWKSASLVANYQCDQTARLPVFERRLPAAMSAVRAFYNGRLAIAADYDRTVLSSKQAAAAKFRATIDLPRRTLQSRAQLALQNDAAAAARQRQEIADLLAALALSGGGCRWGHRGAAEPPADHDQLHYDQRNNELSQSPTRISSRTSQSSCEEHN